MSIRPLLMCNAVVLVVILSALPASAVITAQDDFNSYSVGELDGQPAGGSGFAGAWDVSPTDREDIVSPSTSLGDGNAVLMTGHTGNNNPISRQLAAAQSGDVYFSYRYRVENQDDANDYFMFWLDDAQEAASSDHPGSARVAWRGEDDYFARIGANASSPSGTIQPGDVQIVGRLYKDASADYNTLDMWVNPTPGDVVNATNIDETAINNSSGLNTVDWIGFRNGNSTEPTAEFLVDDVVLGTAAIDPFSPADGLVARYRLDESSAASPVVDSTGFQPNGTNNGATPNQPGKFGTAFAFDGVNDKIALNTDTLVPASDDFSMFMYINTEEDSSPQYLLNNYVFGEDGRFSLQINDGNLGYFIESTVVDSGVFVADGQWRLVGLTREAGDLALWVDAVKYDVADVSLDIGVSDEWYLGGRVADNLRQYEGLVDDVRVYYRALSANEVRSLLAIPEPTTTVLLVGLATVLLARRPRRRCA